MGKIADTSGVLGWIPSLQADKAWARTRRVFTDTEVLYGLALSAVNTTFLVGKATSYLPAVITHLAYTSLRFIGALWVHVQLRCLHKSGGDLLFSLSNHCWTRVSYMTSMIFVQGTGVCLTVGGTVAAVATTLSYGSTAAWIFAAMRPWGLAALLVQIALDVIAQLTDRSLVESMQQVSQSRHQVEDFFRAYQPGVWGSSEAGLAAAVRSRMDLNTWGELEGKARSLLTQNSYNPLFYVTRNWRLQRIFRVAIQNLRTQQEEAKFHLARTAVGYVFMGITRAYPQTLIEAILNWTINLYWTNELLSRKYQQAGHQEAILST